MCQVEYRTVDESALSGVDYEAAQGTLVFENGQKSCKVSGGSGRLPCH